MERNELFHCTAYLLFYFWKAHILLASLIRGTGSNDGMWVYFIWCKWNAHSRGMATSKHLPTKPPSLVLRAPYLLWLFGSKIHKSVRVVRFILRLIRIIWWKLKIRAQIILLSRENVYHFLYVCSGCVNAFKHFPHLIIAILNRWRPIQQSRAVNRAIYSYGEAVSFADRFAYFYYFAAIMKNLNWIDI